MSATVSPSVEAARFADFLDAHQQTILDLWMESVAADHRIRSSDQLSQSALEDHLPDILARLADLFRRTVANGEREALERDTVTHGRERWFQGYSLSEVLLEIDRFRKILLIDTLRDFAREQPELSIGSYRRIGTALFDFSQELIVGSVEEYTRAKEAELHDANDEIRDANRRLSKANARLQLETEKVRALSLQDPLTGLANRRHLDMQLPMEIERCERYGDALSLILMDLDDFKGINDRYGHKLGDEVLRQVAVHLRSHCRSADRVTRYGGEEFLALLPKTTLATAEVLAERVRRSLAELRVEGIDRSVTGSFGLSQWSEGDTAADLIARADEAMYRAKAEGRNRIVVSSTSIA